MERPWQACLLLTLAALAFPPGCGRKQAPPPVVPGTEAPAYQPAPWTWHKVGGVLVVTGEVLAPMEVTLTGRHMNERVYAEPGPIRWEFYAPPAGEVVTLRTSEGKLLAKWNLDVPMPEAEPAPSAVPPVAARPVEAPWPETHLPVPKGPFNEPPTTPQQAAIPVPVVTWNPLRPVTPRVAVKPAEAPWPETHLPLSKGPFRRAPALPRSAMPQQAKAPAPLVPAKPTVPRLAANPPWPETHLPLSKGLYRDAPATPAPVATWNPLRSVTPKVAAKPAEAPWPETHLPLSKGPFRTAPALPPSATPQQATAPAPLIPAKPVAPRLAANPPWPETRLPLSKGAFLKAPAPPPATASRLPWPETHLPRSKGLFRITLSKPVPVPLQGVPPLVFPLPAMPAQPTLPAAPGMAVRSPWPETHLPRSKGLFRVTLSKPAPLPADGFPGAAFPVPVLPALAVTPVRPAKPILAKVMNDVWPETHLPLAQGEPRKLASKLPPPVTREPKSPVAPPVLPVPALEPVPPPALAGPTAAEWPGQGEAFNLIRGPRGSHWVCITFDGGSSDEVALDVLNALKERGICTTFFLTGDFIEKFPEIVRRIVRDGHEVGNHTMDHPHLAPGGKRDPRWTKERFQQQLLRADAAFLRLAGRPMDPYWRAPYGEQTTEIRKWAEELGYRHIAWSEGADTLDWATVKERKLYRTGNAILDRLHERMERQDGDGLIVLMHLGSTRPEGDRPARVLGPFLDQVLDEGWNFVNIGAYLKEAGKARWDASIRLAMLTPRPAHP